MDNKNKMTIKNLFEDLQHNQWMFLSAKTWTDFEDRIESYLKLKLWYSKILKEDINDFKQLKGIVQDKETEDTIIKNTKWKHLANSFVSQPFWWQDYPDFLVILEDRIIPLEIKFTTANKETPMWNSGVPRNTGIYIFWSYWLQDITFFKWSDVISDQERNMMIKFFNKMKELENTINKEIAKINKYWTWFQVYVRRAYQQKKVSNNTNVSFFNNQYRKAREDHVISIFN